MNEAETTTQSRAMDIIQNDVLSKPLTTDALSISSNTNPNSKPHVTLTFAQSLDAFIGGVNRTPIQLSGSESLIFTHCIRWSHDAILIGIQTLLSDSPQLNVRYVRNLPKKDPFVVIIDPKLRIPLKHYIFDRKPIIVCLDGLDILDYLRVERAGGVILKCPAISMASPASLTVPPGFSPRHIIPPVFQTCRNHIDLNVMLYKLRNEHSIERLMVEGGATVIGHFLEQKLYTSLVITICPKFIGQGVSLHHSFSHSLSNVSYHKFGEDIVLVHKT